MVKYAVVIIFAAGVYCGYRLNQFTSQVFPAKIVETVLQGVGR